jgi:hypothetical protein
VRPKVDLSALKKTKAWEYVVRWVFGGLITAAAGFVAEKYGPAIGGLLLGFPAILPASLTLVKRHDGRPKAVDDARGACLGSLALALFGVIVACTAQACAATVVLLSALAAWMIAAASAWWVKYGKTAGARGPSI